MMAQILDYAGGRPRAAAIRDAGYAGVVRYLTAGGLSLPGKQLTADELADLQAHGLDIALVWETIATRMRDGADAGKADATVAAAYLRKIGLDFRAIYFVADWDVGPGEQQVIDAYERGAGEIIGPDRVGIYGGYWVVRRCLDNGSARWAWQTSAWSGGNVDPRIHLFQRAGTVTVDGVPCDVNDVKKTDYGQLEATAVLTDDDVARIAKAVWSKTPETLIPDPFPHADPALKNAADLVGFGSSNAALSAGSAAAAAATAQIAATAAQTAVAEVQAIHAGLTTLRDDLRSTLAAALETGVLRVEWVTPPATAAPAAASSAPAAP